MRESSRLGQCGHRAPWAGNPHLAGGDAQTWCMGSGRVSCEEEGHRFGGVGGGCSSAGWAVIPGADSETAALGVLLECLVQGRRVSGRAASYHDGRRKQLERLSGC